MLVLCFVRHGETTANRDNILQGSVDYPLTEKGRREAVLVGRALRNVKWDRIYTSDLERAANTCRIMLDARRETNVGGDGDDNDGPSASPDKMIREISYGVREGLSRSISVAEARSIVAEKLGIAVDAVVDTAESMDQVHARQGLFLQKLREEFAEHDGRTRKILCVSHGGFIKRFLATYCNKSLEKIHNCSISVVNVTWGDKDGPIVCSAEYDSELNSVAHISREEGDCVCSFPRLL